MGGSFSTVGDSFSTVGDSFSTVGIASVLWGIASVLWRLFSTVGGSWGGTSVIFIRVRADLVLKPNPV